MTAIKGLGTYGNAAGVVTPLDHKIAQAGSLVKTTTALKVRAGVFYNGVSNLVTGTAGMAYSVAAYHLATQRSAGAGVVFGGNDGALSVATTAAPGSNSRIDIIYHWHREFSLDGTDSNPVIGVVQGTAAPSPVAPSLAAFPGAVEIARATVAAGATATNGAGVTVTNTCPFTTSDGGVVVVRTTTERDAFTDALEGQLVYCLADEITYRWNGAAWKGWSSDWIAFTPTLTNFTIGTGGAAANTAEYKFVNGDVRVKGSAFLGASGFSVGTGVSLTLPVTAATPAITNQYYQAGAILSDASVPTQSVAYVRAAATSTTSVQVLNQNATTGNPQSITSAVPWTWAAGDGFAYDFTYKAA